MADKGAASIRAYTKVAIRRKGEASPFILVVVDLFAGLLTISRHARNSRSR